jgi:predicted ATPase
MVKKCSHIVSYIGQKISKNVVILFLSSFFPCIPLLSGAPKIYVIIGGPGNGKSTLCDALAQKGFTILPEAATIIKKEEQEKGIERPWEKLDDFQRKILERQLTFLESIKDKNEKEIVFSDRGVFDAFAYYTYENLTPIKELSVCIEKIKYAGVFCLAPLPEETYKETKIRHEDRNVALKLHDLLFETYKNLGFNVIIVPPVSIKERVALIEEKLKEIK